MILESLKKRNIKNVLIFVSDSLRWDYTPQKIIDKGISIKTIASSLYTAPSFPSIVSGLYPPKTGVYNWEDVLKENLRGLFNFSGYNSSLWCETTWINVPPWESDLHNVLGKPLGKSLDKIQTPFMYLEDDKGGHSPYGMPFGHYKSFKEFYNESGKKGISHLADMYLKGVTESEDRFFKRIQILEERGLIDETLVVFTSDHGELLGEYGGLVGHGRPPCPELVFVPTVFIHPSLSPLKIEGIMRHVDLFPTIASVLGKKVEYDVDGIDLTSNSLPETGLNFRSGGYFTKNGFLEQIFDYSAISNWQKNGGHIFHYLKKYLSYPLFAYKIFIEKHSEFEFFNTNLIYNSKNKLADSKKVLHALAHDHICYGSPKVTKEFSKNVISQKLVESERFKEKNKIKEALLKIKI